MTMLELLELQARARAIRSQLALEPVTKIELDSDDDEQENKTNGKEAPTTSNDKKTEKEPQAVVQEKSVEKIPEKNAAIDRPVRRVAPPPPSPKPTPPGSQAKPMKLKRNYKSQTSDGAPSTVTQKEPTPPKNAEAIKAEENDDDRCSSPDVINMDPSPQTFFISDSEDDEPAPKKSPQQKEESPINELVSEPKENEVIEESQQVEEGELSAKSSRENSPEAEKEESGKSSPAPAPDPEQSNDNAMNDDDVVHLMSDTEIDLHHHSDKEDEDAQPEEKSEGKQETVIEEPPKKTPERLSSVQSDDDVVEINNSTDDELMNEPMKPADEPSSSQTWQDRWLSSSKTQSILKTTQLASKVRGKIIKTKKTQKADEKKKAEKDKIMKEKVSSLEEGSMEQFKGIKRSEDSSAD